ncbi:hypothetical protein KDL30_15080 [bacterium]|nr:hypothetical protein [bacterium]
MQDPGELQLDLVLGLYGRDGSLPHILRAPAIPLADALPGISRIRDELGQHALLSSARLELPLRLGHAGQPELASHRDDAQASLSLGLETDPPARETAVPVLASLDTQPLSGNRARRLRSIVRRVLREHNASQRD